MRGRFDVGPKGQKLLWTLMGGVELVHNGWNETEWKTMMLPYGWEEAIAIWGLLQDHDVVVKEWFTEWQQIRPRLIGMSRDEYEEYNKHGLKPVQQRMV